MIVPSTYKKLFPQNNMDSDQVSQLLTVSEFIFLKK